MNATIYYLGQKRVVSVDGETSIMDVLELNNLPTSNVEIKLNGNKLTVSQLESINLMSNDLVQITAGKQASGTSMVM